MTVSRIIDTTNTALEDPSAFPFIACQNLPLIPTAHSPTNFHHPLPFAVLNRYSLLNDPGIVHSPIGYSLNAYGNDHYPFSLSILGFHA